VDFHGQRGSQRGQHAVGIGQRIGAGDVQAGHGRVAAQAPAPVAAQLGQEILQPHARGHQHAFGPGAGRRVQRAGVHGLLGRERALLSRIDALRGMRGMRGPQLHGALQHAHFDAGLALAHREARAQGLDGAHGGLHDEGPVQAVRRGLHEDFATLIDAISELRGVELTITHRVRATRARWQQLALTNAEQALGARLANRQHLSARFEALAEALELDEPPMRLECFDISHSSGEATVASCVVFGPEGPLKSDYRRYNIEGVTAGDDYAAMHQALSRRFRKAAEGEGKLPDILLVDGGKGQLNMARELLEELAVPELILLGVAKGVTRKPGLETLYLNDAAHEFTLPADSPALHLIQQVRDEAHRFAITGHRARRGKARRTSTLEDVPGIGPKRRRELLTHFGGLQELCRASLDEIAKAPGISKKLAESIYAALHSE